MTGAAGDALTILTDAAQRAGLDTGDARILHHQGSTVALLPHEAVVARRSLGDEAMIHRVITSLDVCRSLSGPHLLATQPLPAPPKVIDDRSVITFWNHYPQHPPMPGPADLGAVVRQLHSQPTPRGLDDWIPLTAVEAATKASPILSERDRDWLLGTITDTRAKLATVDSRLGWGLIHADAWTGNLLHAGDRVILCDWDDVGYGPREADLIPTWHAVRRFNKPADTIAQFTRAYGHDLTEFDGLETLLAMRDLMQLTNPLRLAVHSEAHRRELHRRLADIRSGNTTAAWNPNPTFSTNA